MPLEVVETPFGKFQIHPQDCIGSTTKAGTLWDGHCLMPVALEYAQLGMPGITVLDIGANIGTFTVWLASKGAWRVIAVESHPQVFSMLQASLDLNKSFCMERVIPLHVAAWSHPTRVCQGRQDVPETDGNLGSHYVLEDPIGSVAGLPLDHYAWLFGNRVSLIKLDIEGAETRALKGLQMTIAKYHPVIVFEWLPEALLYDPGESPIPLLESWGYTVHPWPTLPSNYLALPYRYVSA